MSTNRNIYRRSIAPHNARVMADGGIPTDNVNAAIELMRFYEEQKDSIKLFYFPVLTGNKIRTSGLNKFVSKGYSLNSPQQESLANDAVQTTSTSQPYLCGNIAPNEKYGLKNPNGGSNYLTHSTISFAANESWNVTTVLNWNGHFTFSQFYLANFSGNGSFFYVKTSGGDRLQVLLNGTYQFQDNSTRKILGKNAIITFDADGLGGLKAYINGIESPVVSSGNNTSVVFAEILRGAYGKIHAHIIRSGTLTASQVLSEYNLIRNFIPEVESVVIGTQTWTTSNCEMASTPLGIPIAEMQAAANVEKVPQSVDLTVAANYVIAGGTVNDANTYTLTTVGGVVTLYNVGVADKWIKVVFSGDTTCAELEYRPSGAGGANHYNIHTPVTGTFSVTVFYKVISGREKFYLRSSGSGVTNIATLSVQEIGWSGATELFNGIYAQTSGSAAQKEYEAYKAAAMWCHFNNDVAQGALYGKMYNWYAIKLMQLDIDTFNTANPTTPWGYKTTLKTDWETMSTYLGGDAVSGGKMKAIFGAFNNQYTNNQSGLSLISAGRRNPTTGNFETGSTYYGGWTVDKWTPTTPTNNTTIEFQNAVVYPQIGLPFRFIKT